MTGSGARLTHLHPVVRGVLLVGSLLVLVSISWATTGEPLPKDESDVLLVQSSLLLVVLATLVSERFFTGPGDAFLNSLSALLTVLPQGPTAPRTAWWSLIGFLFVVFVAALVSLLLQAGTSERATKPWVLRIQAACFQVSSTLGRARVVFSAVFLTAIAFFVDKPGPLETSLLVFWGCYLVLWPLGIPQLVSRFLRKPEKRVVAVGYVSRVDSPNLARASLAQGTVWVGREEPLVVHLPDGVPRWGLPLMSENRADGLLGTLLLGDGTGTQPLAAGLVVAPIDVVKARGEFIADQSEGHGADILGLVREGSLSTRLRFELLPGAPLTLGQLVVVGTEVGWIYYQIVEGETSEEPFGGSLNYGSQIATAVPIGVLTDAGTFERAGWLPKINAPVYTVDSNLANHATEAAEFSLGVVPGTELSLRGSFVAHLESHTAILGATGSGKTEFAFDLIRHAVDQGVKVVCIDLTSQYRPRLNDLSPVQLTIDDAKAADLGAKLFDAETGTYGAGAEKKVLHDFAAGLRVDVEARLSRFLDGDANLALIELREIANTKATLWLTEMYLSTLLNLAKEGLSSKKVLVVVEEAHTVMPEAGFAGLGDFDSKGTIAKITQIALQGRKYGVGLLVLAQRTATVSKSVLTQCNTVISFACVDDTSINFLRNVFGSGVAESLPGLRKLRAVAHGQWIRSELPITFDVPFDQDKAAMTDWQSQIASRSSSDGHAGRGILDAPEAVAEDDEPPF